MIGRFRQQDDTDPVEPKGFDDYEFRLGDVMRGERATLGKSLLDVQRELKIKATYVAAIENSDPTAFETPGFIAGYVRSYARYLDLDPEWAYRAFCAESGFATAHGMSQAASSRRAEPAREEDAPFGSRNLGVSPPGESLFSRIEPGAIGSVAVLLGLIGVLGYGGYRVLNEVQKVQFVPVDQAPEVVADIDPLDGAAPIPTETDDPARTAMIDDGFDRLYRPQALDVPVMVARDAPISTLDPRRAGALAGQGTVGTPPGTEAPAPVMDLAGLDAFGGPGPDRPEEPAAPRWWPIRCRRWSSSRCVRPGSGCALPTGPRFTRRSWMRATASCCPGRKNPRPCAPANPARSFSPSTASPTAPPARPAR